jgi:trehalose 6-phosphate phosphatase
MISIPDGWNDEVFRKIRRSEHARLFLDYDGTLAELAPSPDHVTPDSEVIALVTELAEHPRIRLAVVSGRRLGHIEALLPISGAILAGT